MILPGNAPGERREDMTDKEAYKILGDRVTELTKKRKSKIKCSKYSAKKAKKRQRNGFIVSLSPPFV